MHVDWALVNDVSDRLLIGAGIVVLIARQFLWRSAEPRRMLALPVVLVIAGLAWTAVSWFAPWTALRHLGPADARHGRRRTRSHLRAPRETGAPR